LSGDGILLSVAGGHEGRQLVDAEGFPEGLSWRLAAEPVALVAAAQVVVVEENVEVL